MLRVSLKPTEPSIQSPRQKSSEVIPIGKLKSPAGLALSSSGEWLVAIGAHRVYVIKTSRLKSGLTKFTSPERLVSLAFHPSEDYFATGDEKGVIRSWFCLKDELMGSSDTEKRAQTTTLHWHAHAVSCLAFASNGAYLLSGGEEAVLVLWQLQSGKKEYVPRVGAPIAGLAVSRSQDREEEYLLALTDGSHLFVSSASLKISRSFSMLKFGESSYFAYDYLLLKLTTRRPVFIDSRSTRYSSTLSLSRSNIHAHPSVIASYCYTSLCTVIIVTVLRARGHPHKSYVTSRRRTHRLRSGIIMCYLRQWRLARDT